MSCRCGKKILRVWCDVLLLKLDADGNIVRQSSRGACENAPQRASAARPTHSRTRAAAQTHVSPP
ncbi:MAG: hypothetical protein WCP70_08945 [Methanothrix sp.]